MSSAPGTAPGTSPDTSTETSTELSTARAIAMYIGALLGPSLLLLPGLAADVAGAASIVAWAGLLIVSGLLAGVFSALGTRIRSGGPIAYTAAGFGPRAGRAVGWCFAAGVVCGAPLVCLIGGAYVAELIGGGRTASVSAAAVLLAAVLVLNLSGARTTTTAQLVLIAVLIVLVAVAVAGSVPDARAANWTPFMPHGWVSIGRAASVLMMCFIGWEAVASLTGRLRDAHRQLPRVIGVAFTVTTIGYLGLAFATVAVLGSEAGSQVALADLLRVAIGSVGPVIAAVAAVALTLATTNAYVSGASALVDDLRTRQPAASGRHTSHGLQLAIALAGTALLSGAAAGLVSTAQLVALPTGLFLVVYVGCTAAATRILAGRMRVVAAVSCGVVVGVLMFIGWPLVVVFAVAAGGLFDRRPLVYPRADRGRAGARRRRAGLRSSRCVPRVPPRECDCAGSGGRSAPGGCS